MTAPVLALAAAAVLWTGGTLAAPLFAATGHPLAAAASRLLYAPLCHQDAARSFAILGVPLSVCHRCEAVYIAFTVTVLASFLPARARALSLPMLTLLLLPMLLDVAFDMLGLRTNTDVTRVATGALAGIGLALFIVPAARELGSELAARRACSTA
ncbi:MAG: DUF2085 domain-containing protein [Ignavibacteria bacterium]|nr:DUF2085 domain-containing protein [Ignavibacteria bacterium]